MISEMNLLKTEWQTRAKTAEANLIKLIKKYERKEKELNAIQQKVKSENEEKTVTELKRLQSIDQQQNQLIVQQRMLLNQWSLGERLKKFMRNTVLELYKKYVVQKIIFV